jgi:hemolysin D
VTQSSPQTIASLTEAASRAPESAKAWRILGDALRLRKDSRRAIVPDDSQLVLDTKIPNRDAGFVRAGQPVRVKVDAFPFTDYGTLEGVLESVSGDAVDDEKLGLVYNARVRILPSQVKSSAIKLSPGMATTAEIKTGRRRIIQYLLSPITTRLDEAGRER